MPIALVRWLSTMAALQKVSRAGGRLYLHAHNTKPSGIRRDTPVENVRHGYLANSRPGPPYGLAPLMRSGVFGNEVMCCATISLTVASHATKPAGNCIGRLITDRLRIDVKEINGSLSIS